MHTLKRKLTAILVMLAMLISLLPAMPQAASARDFGLVENDYISWSYPKPATGIDSAAGTVKIIVQNSEGKLLDSRVINDYAKRLTGTNTITLKQTDRYDIEKIEMSEGPVTLGDYSAKEASFEWTFDAFGKDQTLTVTLCDPYEPPEINDPIERTSVSYRVSYAQLLKLMYLNGVTDVSETTDIIKVQPIWVQSYGPESNKEFNFIGGTIGDDYWNQVFTSNSGDSSEVNPGNMRYLEVTYNDGTGEKITKIPAKMMKFTGSSDKTYYQIESINEDVHVVAFYNETSSMTGDQYDLYAVRFVVDPAQTVGEENMPADPIYTESLSDYKFVNWEIEGYYGDNGEAFLPTTIVDRDMNVFAHKVSSSYSGGTEIRVMNEYGGDTNQLLDRLVEGYNEKYSADITADQIDMTSVKVRVNGTNDEYTNEHYYSNSWQSQNEYYLVHNFDAPGVTGGIDENQNTHIGFNEVSGIVVYFSLTGQSDNVASVTIPVGNNVGDLAKMMKGVGADHILQLYVIQDGQVVDQPVDPDPEPGDDLNGTDVTVQVVVDGTPVKAPLSYVTLSRDTTDTDYKKFVQKSIDENGVITYDFDYYVPTDSSDQSTGFDCVDIEVAINSDKSAYILQGVTSYQAHGQNGTSNVDDNSDDEKNARNTFTVDNVTSDNDDETVDCIIYLRSKYSVEYYLGGVQQTGDDYKVGAVYLAAEDVTTTTPEIGYPQNQTATLMNWQNNANYDLKVAQLPGLPDGAEGETVSGWYLGSVNATGTTYVAESEFTAIDATSDKADGTEDKNIKFFAVSTPVTPDPSITGLEKALVASAEDVPSGITASDFDFPKDDVVIIPNGGEVTLLYSITVEGTANTTFTVTDSGAKLVEVDDIDVEDGTVEDTFTGTIPTGGSITFYVSKIFDSDSIVDGKLKNIATIEGVTPATEETPAEEAPALPDETWLNAKFDVELDCTSNVGHENKKYEDLITDSYKLEKLTYVEAGKYTVDLVVDSELYIDDFDDSTSATHQNDGESTKTIKLTYQNNAWTAPANPYTIEFDVKCSGTGGYDINGIAKDLVAGEADKQIATANGVDNLGAFTIPEEGETVIIPAGETVTLLYSITVTGGDEAVDFEVEDKDTTLVKSNASVAQDETTGIYSGTIPESGSVTFYVSKTFDGDDINNAGKLVNVASVDGKEETTTVDPKDDIEETVDAEEAISVTPADITIYMGGEDGYDGVTKIDADGNITGTGSTSLPEPGFTVTLPKDVEGTDVTSLTFKEKDGTRTWTFKPYDGQEATTVYKLVPAEGQEQTRVIFTDQEDGHTIISDEFTVGLEVNTSFDMALYKGSGETVVGDIETTIDGVTYAVDSDNIGELTVRGTTDDVQFADANVDVDNSEVPELDVAEGTTFTINGGNVLATDKDGIALLFDEVINTEGADRTALLENKADSVLNVAEDEMNYDFKYLDLVDRHNGNTWVKASQDVTIYWPLPEGTTENTEFSLLHFKDLHREMASSDVVSEIANCEVETDTSAGTSVEIVDVTDEYVIIQTGDTGFSPFALAWDADNGSGDNPGGGGGGSWHPSNPGGDGPSGLNTEDHFSYIVGYAEDYRTGEATDDESLWPVKPQNNITRAEVATIFYRLLEDEVRDEYDTTVNNFSDVSADAWYNQTVSTLSSMGIVKGYEDGTFRPNAPITRAEFGAIATRFFEETGATYEPGTFSDVVGDEWFAGAIQDAVNLGLIGGYEDGTVRPNNNITRAEACAIVNRTLGRVPDVDHLLPEDVMKTWPDNPESAWFYADMQEATNGHEYEWITEDGNKVENWTEIMLDNDWTER